METISACPHHGFDTWMLVNHFYDGMLEAFKYLYREQFKEFGRLMKERDKELEDNDVYMRKIWHESLDLINTSLSNMLGYISELERTMNKVGQNQDRLITLVEFTNDICTSGKEEPTDKIRPDTHFQNFLLVWQALTLILPISYLPNPIREESEFSQILLFFPFSNCSPSSPLIKAQYSSLKVSCDFLF